jgi:hypothetical protein
MLTELTASVLELSELGWHQITNASVKPAIMTQPQLKQMKPQQ